MKPEEKIPLEELMKGLHGGARSLIPKEFGLAILVFPLERAGLTNYISDAQRPEMIKLLRELADRLEQNNTFPLINKN